MKILIVTGSRADYGLLEWPIKTLQEDAYFQGSILNIWGAKYDLAFAKTAEALTAERPDMMLVLGDRFEILAAVTAAHLLRVPVAHIGGGDVTEGSYDDAMRGAISLMASVHFVTSTSAMARLSNMGLRNIHLVGNPGIDYIRNAGWKRERPIEQPYVVVSYQPETIDDTVDMEEVIYAVGDRKCVCMLPNHDRGSERIVEALPAHWDEHAFLPHSDFLNLIFHCEEFIGNSSAMLYEAPELGIKTRMIGKRQKGRTIPWGDGQASKRIANILKYTA
jgi:UDP-hydrolysing UDP-N-acetyl-D-glucosamine 2-epimerase